MSFEPNYHIYMGGKAALTYDNNNTKIPSSEPQLSQLVHDAYRLPFPEFRNIKQ